MVQARIAFTRDSNTPESDMQRQVPHIVQGTVLGKPFEVEIMAVDPMDAIAKVNRMSVEVIVSINKVK